MVFGESDGERSLVLGVVLMAGMLVLGGVLLTVAVAVGAHAWQLGLFMVLALVGVGAYVGVVFLPALRRMRDAAAVRRVHEGERGAVSGALAQLRMGDLVATVEPARELATDLRGAVEAAVRSLSTLIQQIQSSSVEVATAARTVQETASELASGSSEQAAAVVEITSTMEELARTAGQIATNAASQAEQAVKAEQAGDAGAVAVEAAVSGVEAVRARMDVIASRTDALGNRSREIYRVLELITEIAQETHILSLNAAIEASAAGEHGQRFSVVADEVRRLAERSRESVDSVRELLEEFTGSIRATVVATEEGSKAAAQVLEQSRSAASSIELLRGALADTAGAAREISLATEEQRTASDQVVLTLKEVSEVIQRMADGLRQFSGTAERLNELGLSIQLLTQSFRIDSARSLKHQAVRWAGGLGELFDNLDAAESRLEEVVKHSPYLELLYLVDREGAMAAYVVNRELVGRHDVPNTVGVGQSYADRPWFQAALRSGKGAVTPVYESLLTGEPCFTIAAAVFDTAGQLMGVVGGDVNVRSWTKI